MASLPGPYSRPNGFIYLAEVDGAPEACIALKRADAAVCEMKRLFVRPEVRGSGIGEALVIKTVNEARRLGYERMRLDTFTRMVSAVKLYRAHGFEEIPPYYENPFEGALYLEKVL